MTKELADMVAELLAQHQNYTILKAFIKAEYEADKYLSMERVIRFIEILEKEDKKK
nr:MAG TPA: hypothetical protein [Caudoviricetes sp.]